MTPAGAPTAASGPFVGVLMLETRFPRPPGDIGNRETFDRAGIPVRFQVVRGASVGRIVGEPDPGLLDAFTLAARQLASEGAALITTSCGFLAGWQDPLARAVPVPVIASSLLQCRHRPAPGIVTFDAASLSPSILAAAAVPAGTPIEGLAAGCELRRRIMDDEPRLDIGAAQRDVVAAARALVARHPSVGQIVLECTNMPPYREAVAQATGRPVHDIETLVVEAWARLKVPRGVPARSRR